MHSTRECFPPDRHYLSPDREDQTPSNGITRVMDGRRHEKKDDREIADEIKKAAWKRYKMHSQEATTLAGIKQEFPTFRRSNYTRWDRQAIRGLNYSHLYTDKGHIYRKCIRHTLYVWSLAKHSSDTGAQEDREWEEGRLAIVLDRTEFLQDSAPYIV